MPTYKEAYKTAGGAAKLGDYGAWEKKAKSWNKETYGTTSPTSKASKKGVTKSTLAKEHKAPGGGTTKIESKGVSPTVGSGGFTGSSRTVTESDALYKENKSHVSAMSGNVINETRANERMQQAVDSATAPENLMTGKAKRQAARSKRQSGRESAKQERKNLLTYNPVDDRSVNRYNRAANKSRDTAAKRDIKQGKKEIKQDIAQRKSDLKYYKKTGTDLSA